MVLYILMTMVSEQHGLYLEKSRSELLCPKKGLGANQVLPIKLSE